MSGCSRCPSTCCTTTNSATVARAISGLTVNASRMAGTAARIGPTIGTKSSSAVMMPSPNATGTPSAHSPNPVSSPTTAMASNCPPSQAFSALPLA